MKNERLPGLDLLGLENLLGFSTGNRIEGPACQDHSDPVIKEFGSYVRRERDNIVDKYHDEAEALLKLVKNRK